MNSNEQIRVSIVIPVFNQCQLTERCLQSLLDHTTRPLQLVVVDNASTDQTQEILTKFKVEFLRKGWAFQVIQNSQNCGFGRACNQGARASQGDFLGILNNDTWLMKGWDEVLIRRAQELDADLIAPFAYEGPYDPQSLPRYAESFVQRNRGKSSATWSSIFMFFRRASFEKIGMFDERYFVTYEDTDLRERMKRAGMKYFEIGDCLIWHFSKGTRESGLLPRDYEVEGKRLFVEKWGFDPAVFEATRAERWKRRLRRWKNRFGLY